MAKMDDGSMPNDLTVFDSGQDLAEIDLRGGDGFWDEVERFAGREGLDAAVDSAMAGKTAPRVWALLDEDGVTGSRVVAALTIARILSDRGQKVVVIDADDRQPDLTRWAGRFELEGWIDFVRYGASVAGCGVDLPWPGTQLLGIGTFCPTGVDAAEIADLIARLRRQADDVLLCLPLEPEASPWLENAGIRLLCWDRLRRGSQETEDLLAGAGEVKESLAGVIAFGPTEERVEAEIDKALQSIEEAPESLVAESEIDVTVRIDIDAESLPTDDEVNEALAEQVDEAEEVEATEETEDDAAVAPVDEETDEETDDVVGDEVEDEIANGIDEKSDDDLVATEEEEEPAAEPGSESFVDVAATEAEAPVEKGSSPVFWRIGGLAAVLVVAIGVCWYMGFFDRGGEEPTELASAPAEVDISPPPTVAEEAAGDGTAGADDASAKGTDVVESGDAEVAAETPTQESVDDGAAGTPEEAPVETPDVTRAETPAEATAETPAVETPGPDWYSGPVGEAGWALHVYSFADSSVAIEEIERLAERDIRGVWRAVELPGKGRWYRIYVGSFADRAEARAAEETLLPRLRLDWAMPVEF